MFIYCNDAQYWPEFTDTVRQIPGDGDYPAVFLGYVDPDTGAWVPVPAVETADGGCWTAHPLTASQGAWVEAQAPEHIRVFKELPPALLLGAQEGVNKSEEDAASEPG